ncbi:MAG: hypothetical protein M0Z50_05695 [Planctomycetia bacterium]|nr:hypothetical protein [Planctomycetia bacterium]
MLDLLKQWLNPPDKAPGPFTDADERMLEHDNARCAANLEAAERIKNAPRYRFRFWFFFF